MLQVGGYLAINLTMPSVLSWVLGGNTRALDTSERYPYCLLDERPKHFCEAVRRLRHQLTALGLAMPQQLWLLCC